MYEIKMKMITLGGKIKAREMRGGRWKKKKLWQWTAGRKYKV